MPGYYNTAMEYVENITYLYNNKKDMKIYLKIMDYMVEDEERKEFFYKTFEPIVDHIGIENCMDHHDAKKKDYKNHVSMFTDADT